MAGLATGLSLGVAVAATHNPFALAIARAVEPVGTLWVNAILMTVIPLVVSNLIVGVASNADSRLVGRIGWRALVLALALYPMVALTSGVTLGRFARAVAPAQAVAFSASSSLASLPALIEGAERRLGLPTAITGFVLPLAVSMFKFTAPVATLTGVFLTSRLYGVAIAPAQLVPTVAVAVLVTIGTPGIPGGGLIAGVPVFVTAGLPAEAIGLFLAVDAIADRFRAPANATADLAAATFLARHLSSPSLQPAPLDHEVAPQF